MVGLREALTTSRTMDYVKSRAARNKKQREDAARFLFKLVVFALWLVWIIPAVLFFYLPRFAWQRFDLWWNRTPTGMLKKTRHMKNSARHQAVGR